MDATTNQIDKDDEHAGDLLVGRKNIRKFLIDLGMPEKVDPSYLKKRRGRSARAAPLRAQA
jgi:hypothetical protein